MENISVLMSVYEKEKGEYLQAALESIRCQSLPPREMVLVEDGRLTRELYQVIAEEKGLFQREGIAFESVVLPVNQGLGRALQEGLKKCSCPWVARMDSDDLSLPTRLEEQAAFLAKARDISVVGTEIEEFIHPGYPLRIKHMPKRQEEILTYAKVRNPLNHMTVLFRKEDVEEAGSYQPLPGLEDYYLWSRMLVLGKRFANLPKPLVQARMGENFEHRRGGFSYFRHYALLRRLQRRMGLLSFPEYLRAVLLSAGITLVPGSFRNRLYGILRRKE